MACLLTPIQTIALKEYKSCFLSPTFGKHLIKCANYQEGNRCKPYNPIMCEALGERARRLSLPTTRELRYLSNIGVRRTMGRARHYTRSTSFSIMVWPLTLCNQDDPSSVSDPTTWLGEDSTISILKSRNNSLESGNRLTEKLLPGDSSAERLANLSDQYLASPQLTDDASTALERHPCKHRESTNFTNISQSLSVNIPAWAYIVSFRVSKIVLGKRAVQRNRAKRRIRAAAAQIFPQFARRGIEYRFNLFPEILVVQQDHLLEEIRTALRVIDCWESFMTPEMLRRDKFCKR